MSAMTDLTAQMTQAMVDLNSGILSVQNQATALTGQMAQMATLMASDPATILQGQLADLQKEITTDTSVAQAAAATLSASVKGP